MSKTLGGMKGAVGHLGAGVELGRVRQQGVDEGLVDGVNRFGERVVVEAGPLAGMSVGVRCAAVGIGRAGDSG